MTTISVKASAGSPTSSPDPVVSASDATGDILFEGPHGSWPSPLTAEVIAAGGVGLGGPAVRPGPSGDEIWWSELRPAEAGRVVLCRRLPDGTVADALPEGLSARTRVHEYGGGAWWFAGDRVVVNNWGDQRLYTYDPDDLDAEPVAITPEPEVSHGWRHADGVATPDGEWLVCVREDHHDLPPGSHEPRNEIVAVPLDGSAEPHVVVTGPDFVAAPRVSPEGRWLSWIEWNHPDMPWDATELKAAPLFDAARLGNTRVIAGGRGGNAVGGGVSIVGPNWTSDGRLVFSSDQTGWWNLLRWRPESDEIETLTSLDDGEIGGPPWVFGRQDWVELGDGTLGCVVTRKAIETVCRIVDGAPIDVGLGLTAIGGLAASGDDLVVLGAIPTGSPGIGTIGPDGTRGLVRMPNDLGIDDSWFSEGEALELAVGDTVTHAFVYPPSRRARAATDGPPPLVVVGHGGPTAHSQLTLNLKVQYWTTRGFAVADVNYRGSTGFGTAYRRQLDGAWGIADVEDCIAVARSLAADRRVDPARMAIRGGSAGGLTVLRALQTSDVFSAGTSLYGVADLEALASDTHKFEARYLDGLVAPFPSGKAVYDERSPINHVDDLSSPMLVMQGSEDEIVPPSQSQAIVAALAAKGVPHAYLEFEGEQHGFRQAPNVIRSFEAELWFYGRVFGFEPADAIEPVAGAVGLG